MTVEDITEVEMWQLVQAVSEDGKYAFLIGAGTSKPKPSGIQTAGELIEEWQEECYEYANPDIELDEWIEKQEKKEMDYDQNEYGFWFEKRHPTRGGRRKRIDDLVRGADPTPAHITLASMMSNDYVPHVLTPNFDDLLFDAFYLFLEDKPNLIDHRAVAPEFKLTRDDPAIVKLHGDYLYDNLQNTDSETEALEPAMEDALQQTVTEYGLVVVGYGGTDDSIMDPLLNADISEHGIYWCVRDPDEIPPKVGELLERPNTHLVNIDGFIDLMEKFYENNPDVELPGHEELVERAEDRANLLEGALVESKEVTAEGEEAAFEHALDKWAAQRAIEKDQFNHAIDLLDGIIESSFEDASAYYNRGNAKADLGRYEDAIEDYNEAIELDPEDASTYYNRGNAKANLERYEDAIEDYDEAIELDPEDASMYFNRGTAKANLERYEDAIEDYDKAMELDPENASIYSNRGVAKANIERYEDAIEDYDEAIELDPENASTYSNRGAAKADLERYEDAIEDFEKAIELNSEYATAYVNQGSAKAELNQHEDAIGDYNKAIEHDSELGVAYFNRGLSKVNLDRYEGAIEDYSKAIEHSSGHIAALLNRAEVRILTGDFEQAEEDAMEAKRDSTQVKDQAESLLLEIITKIVQEKDTDYEEDEYQNLCDKEFTTSWYFGHLDSWLVDANLNTDKQSEIERQIDLLREHQENQ